MTTNDDEIAHKIRMLRDHGQAQKYYHDMEGYNGRLDALQAGILRVKLAHLAGWNEDRRICARRYNELMAAAEQEIILPNEPSWAKAIYHLYVIRVRNRDGLQKHLADVGIGTGIHYPVPLHQQKAYANLGYQKGDFPVCEKVAAEILSLPMFPGLDHEQQVRIAREVQDFVGAQPVSRTTAAVHASNPVNS